MTDSGSTVSATVENALLGQNSYNNYLDILVKIPKIIIMIYVSSVNSADLAGGSACMTRTTEVVKFVSNLLIKKC